MKSEKSDDAWSPSFLRASRWHGLFIKRIEFMGRQDRGSGCVWGSARQKGQPEQVPGNDGKQGNQGHEALVGRRLFNAPSGFENFGHLNLPALTIPPIRSPESSKAATATVVRRSQPRGSSAARGQLPGSSGHSGPADGAHAGVL